jgi:hypothetical protein
MAVDRLRGRLRLPLSRRLATLPHYRRCAMAMAMPASFGRRRIQSGFGRPLKSEDPNVGRKRRGSAPGTTTIGYFMDDLLGFASRCALNNFSA